MRFPTRSPGGPLRGVPVAFIAATLLLITARQAQAQSMMTRHVRPEVTSGQARFVNRLPGTQTLRLDVVLPLRDPAGLESFLESLYDPTSPVYRHFLTVPEFTARFGPTQQDYDAVVAFAAASGLKVVGGSRDGLDLQLEGSVTEIEAAFNVSLSVYRHLTEDRSFYAPDREPTVPLPFPLWHVSGLDNYSIPHPALARRNLIVKPNTTTGSCPSGSYCGSDMRAAYYGSGSLTGKGQYVGLLEYYGFDMVDVATYFRNARQINNVPIEGVSTDGTSLTCLAWQGCDDTEQTLDITQAVSMAPGLSALWVFVGSSDTAILSSMSTHAPLCYQLSSSWTWSPADPSTDDPYFEKFAAQGQNFFQAAGDSGAYTGQSTYVYPADDAYVTSVGGTDLATSGPGGAWVAESAWADGGGGFYANDGIAIPSWQQLAGVITATNRGSATYRNAPDVAAEANFDYYVCADQTTCTANNYGGTSFAAPLWAGYMALVNQQAHLNGNAVLGFINPLIYPLGLGANYDTAFHDITNGSNGYPAVAGYDLSTGWGSPNGAGLINALAGVASSPNFSISASPASASVPQGSGGNSTITSAISGGFSAPIALSATGQPGGVTVTFSPTSIGAPGAGTSTMTMTVSSITAAGTYTLTVTGTGGGITQATTVSLTVTGTGMGTGPAIFSMSASPTTVTVARSSSTQATVTTVAVGNFDSAVSLSASGLPSGVSAAFSPGSIAAPGSGTSTMTISANSLASLGLHVVTVIGKGGGEMNSVMILLSVEQ